MLTRPVMALLLAAPLSLALAGCATSAFKPRAAVSRQPQPLSSSHTDRLLQLAQRYEKQGNYEGAQRLYQQAEKSSPGNPQAQNSLAAIAARQKQSADRTSNHLTADTRATGHDEPARDETGQAARDFMARAVAETSPEQGNAKWADAPLPSVQPSRGADWSLASETNAGDHSGHLRSESSDDPAWWRASQAVATTDMAPSSGAWTPTSWTTSETVNVPDLTGALQRLGSASAADRKEALVDVARMGSDAATAVPAVQSLTHDADALVQAHAAWALWTITQEGTESVPVLAGLLGSHDADVVQVSAYLLGSIGPEAAGSVNALQAVLGQADTETRLYAAEALSRITPESADAVQILIAALESTERESRWLGAVALAGVAPPHRGAAVAALTTALQDPDPEICAVAALTLGGFGGEAGMAVPQLERALSHPFEDVRMAAETALACIVR